MRVRHGFCLEASGHERSPERHSRVARVQSYWVSWLLAALFASMLPGCGGSSNGGLDFMVAPSPAGILGGSGAATAVAVLGNQSSGPAGRNDVELGVILTRLEVLIASDATVDQFNAAARSVGATGIASSASNSPALTLEVPQQPSIAALNSLAERLRRQPGVVAAAAARTGDVSVLPAESAGVLVPAAALGHMLVSRYPQAWNARETVGTDCLPHSVLLYVWDNFGQGDLRPGFFDQIDPSSFLAAPRLATFDETDNAGGHGYDVTLVAAAKFDAIRPTGAQPFGDCLLIRQVESAGTDFTGAINGLQSQLRAEGASRFVMNVSFGFAEPLCGLGSGQVRCNATEIATTSANALREQIRQRVLAAAQWAVQTRSLGLDERLLITVAAGNVDEGVEDGFLERRYPGLRDSRFMSPITLAAHLSSIRELLTDRSLWTSPNEPSSPDLTFSSADVDELLQDLQHAYGAVPTSLPDSNLLIVASAGCGGESTATGTCTEDFSKVEPSSFNYSGGQVRAIGEMVQLDGVQVDGTSFAAPQVAGLAAWLWTLSPDLESQPVASTINLILRTARRNDNLVVPLIDAYSATMQLDGFASATNVFGVRKGLMDANGDGNFDHLDLLLFRSAYQLGDPGRPSIPAARDYSRFDLNGDGFTGGILIGSFDLDATPLTAGGQLPSLTAIERTVEGYGVSFNEAALSDLQILCFYAYSDVYARAPGNRDEALTERTRLLGPDQCVSARLSPSFPASISSATPLTVRVEVPIGGGQFGPAAGVHVSAVANCGSLSPDSGITDTDGRFATTVTPAPGCAAVKVNLEARAGADTPPLAQGTVSAAVVTGLLAGQITQTGSETAFGGSLVESWNFSANVALKFTAQDVVDEAASGAIGDFRKDRIGTSPTTIGPPETCTLVETIIGTFSSVSGGFGVITLRGVGTITLTGTKRVGGVCVDGTEPPRAVSIDSSIGSTIGGTTGLPYTEIRVGDQLVGLDFARSEEIISANASFNITTTGELRF